MDLRIRGPQSRRKCTKKRQTLTHELYPLTSRASAEKRKHQKPYPGEANCSCTPQATQTPNKTSEWHPRWCEWMPSPSSLTDAENVTSSPMAKRPRYDAARSRHHGPTRPAQPRTRRSKPCSAAPGNKKTCPAYRRLLLLCSTSRLLRSTSSSFLFCSARDRRNETALLSSVSLATRIGNANDGAPSEVPRTVRSHLCGSAPQTEVPAASPEAGGVGALKPECVSSGVLCGFTLFVLWWNFSARASSTAVRTCRCQRCRDLHPWRPLSPVCTGGGVLLVLVSLRGRASSRTPGRTPAELAVFCARRPTCSAVMQGPPPTPLRRSAVRAEASSAAVAPVSAGAACNRHAAR